MASRSLIEGEALAVKHRKGRQRDVLHRVMAVPALSMIGEAIHVRRCPTIHVKFGIAARFKFSWLYLAAVSDSIRGFHPISDFRHPFFLSFVVSWYNFFYGDWD